MKPDLYVTLTAFFAGRLFCSAEVAAEMGVCETYVRDRLRRFEEDGKIVEVQAGMRVKFTLYRLAAPEAGR